MIEDRDELMRRIDELTKTVEALEARLPPADAAVEPAAVQATGSRRDLLRLAGTAAAGVVAGSVLASSQPAAATTGQTLLLGNIQQASNITVIGNGSSASQFAGSRSPPSPRCSGSTTGRRRTPTATVFAATGRESTAPACGGTVTPTASACWEAEGSACTASVAGQLFAFKDQRRTSDAERLARRRRDRHR